MPVVGGNTNENVIGMGRSGYTKDPIARYAASFQECVNDILNEGQINLFTEPTKAFSLTSTNETMKDFFLKEAFDPEDFSAMALDESDAAEMIEDQEAMMEALYDNNRKQILSEYAAMNNYNPMLGMSFPLHKFILMNNIFDKGAIPKVVAKEPKFTISMETRWLVTPEGEEIDMWKEQWKMRGAIDSTAPIVEVELALPETGSTSILEKIGYTDSDNLSIETHISAVKMKVYLDKGDVNPETGEVATTAGEVDCWIPVNMNFVPSYGEYDRTMTERVTITTRDKTDPTKTVEVEDVLMGYTQKNRFVITSSTGNVSDVRLSTRIDTSSAMIRTCSVKWSVRTDIIEIPNAIPINVPISPEEIKDVGALYNVNQLTKVLSLMKTALGNYKDDKIKDHLDESFLTMDPDAKIATAFDFAPQGNYAFDYIEWRHKTFMDFVDANVTVLLQYLNDPNMTVTVFGSPELIRRITPTEWTYQSPSSIGPVELNFVKTIATSDKRVYQFIGSDKLRGNTNFIIILSPRNSERIMYRIYDYQMYVSNEIRNMQNYALPAIHAFERWKFVEYQPVQGRIKIVHPMGLVDMPTNDDPIGKSFRSDLNLLQY